MARRWLTAAAALGLAACNGGGDGGGSDLGARPAGGAACEPVGDLASNGAELCFCGNERRWHCVPFDLPPREGGGD